MTENKPDIRDIYMDKVCYAVKQLLPNENFIVVLEHLLLQSSMLSNEFVDNDKNQFNSGKRAIVADLLNIVGKCDNAESVLGIVINEIKNNHKLLDQIKKK